MNEFAYQCGVKILRLCKNLGLDLLMKKDARKWTKLGQQRARKQAILERSDEEKGMRNAQIAEIIGVHVKTF